MDRQSDLMVAIEAVQLAAQVCQAVQADLVNAETIEKKDKSPVTVADFASQAVVCAVLGSYSQDPIVGEEGSADLRGDDAAAARADRRSRTPGSTRAARRPP